MRKVAAVLHQKDVFVVKSRCLCGPSGRVLLLVGAGVGLKWETLTLGLVLCFFFR